MRFVSTGVDDEKRHGEQADGCAGNTGEMVVHRGGGQCRAADDRTDGVAEVEGDLHAGPGDQFAAAFTDRHGS